MPDKVIFWDFERTLAIRKGRWPAALADALESHSVSVDPETLLPHLTTGFPWRHPDVPHPELNDPDAWWSHMHQVFVKIYIAAGIPNEQAEATAKDVRAAYLMFDRWHIYPDTIPALQTLTKAGWTHFVLSNHVPELPQIVNAIGLGEHFADVITSAAVGYEKPHPEIYRLALARAGDPETRYMIGDKPDEDVLAPEKAGIPGVLVRGNDPRAKNSFDDLTGVTRFLR